MTGCLVLAAVTLVALATPAAAAPRGPVFAQADASRPVAPPAPSAIRWIEVDERGRETLRAAVVSPEGIGPAPVVIVLHGTEGFSEDDVHLAEAYARAGFLAVAGCWFAGNECPRGPAFYGVTVETTRHVRALISAVLGLPRTRGDRIGLFGHSRGAMLALLVASTGSEVRAVVSSSGQLEPAYTASRKPTPIDVAPITMVSSLHVPVLLLHATNDPQADVKAAHDYERALRERGIPVEAHYDDVSTHWLPFIAETRDDVIRRSIEFFRKHLAG